MVSYMNQIVFDGICDGETDNTDALNGAYSLLVSGRKNHPSKRSLHFGNEDKISKPVAPAASGLTDNHKGRSAFSAVIRWLRALN